MTVEHSEYSNAVSNVHVCDMRVLHWPSPALHGSKTISKLRTSINELNQKGRERLVDAFEKVNKKFNDVYTKLFNGGTAKLEFVESEDPLDAGLEMLVSPPGKRLQSITLLSGGEQALTALSLIFAGLYVDIDHIVSNVMLLKDNRLLFIIYHILYFRQPYIIKKTIDI